MSDVKEALVREAQEQHKHVLKVIESIPERHQHLVDFAGRNGVFFFPCGYDRMIKLLHGQNYEMTRYYAASDNNVAVVYDIGDNIDWVFFIPEEDLNRLSKGNCEIKIVTKTERTIVCGNKER